MEYLYQYAFYRIYKFSLSLNKPSRLLQGKFNYVFYAVYYSLSILTLLIFIDLLVIDFFLVHVNELFKNYKILDLLIFIILYASNALYFLGNKKYLEIEIRFKNETLKQKLISTVVLLTYIILTTSSIFIIKLV